MLAIVAAILISTAAGVAAERRWPDRAGPRSRSSLLVVLYVILPPTTFFNLAAIDFDANLGGGIVIGWVSVALAALAAWSIASRWLHLTRPQVGAVMACTITANTGYLGYPLTAALLGIDEVSVAVAYDIGVQAPALLIGAFAVGAAFGDKAGSGARERTGSFFARNLPLYAAVAALFAPDALAPELAVEISRIVVIAILPIGFFAVGAALAEEADAGDLRIPPPLTKPTLAVFAAKLMILPISLYLIALPLIDLPGTYLLMALMPTGLNSMIVAHAYGLDLSITAEAIAWTTSVVVLVALVVSLV
jgi:predicted permease